MRALYRQEPLIPASPITALANMRILLTQAAAARKPLSEDQSRAAMEMACRLSNLISRHGARRARLS
jgi:hypothetical protein